jgi:hypothetical protein
MLSLRLLIFQKNALYVSREAALAEAIAGIDGLLDKLKSRRWRARSTPHPRFRIESMRLRDVCSRGRTNGGEPVPVIFISDYGDDENNGHSKSAVYSGGRA